MAFDIVIPRLGLTMESGRIVEWYKQEGERVAEGEAIFAIETDKAVQDIISEVSGTVHRIPDLSIEPLPIGTVIGHILTPGEELAENPTLEPPTEVAPAPAAPADAQPPLAKARKLASPAARRRAKELGLDMSSLGGLGDTPVTSAQIEELMRARALATEGRDTSIQAPEAIGVAGRGEATKVEQAGTFQEEQIIPLSAVRRVTRERMVECARTVVPATLTTEADATELVALREKLRLAASGDSGCVPSFTALFVRLTAKALELHPLLNARLENAIILQKRIHIAVAVDTDEGLLAPVIRDVPNKSVQQIAADLNALAQSARSRQLGPDDLQGGTFTVTNLGAFGIDAFTPVINLPQCAILGFGRIIPKPAVVDGKILPRDLITLSLTHDHRLVDGAPAARFLATVREFVEQPSLWVETRR